MKCSCWRFAILLLAVVSFACDGGSSPTEPRAAWVCTIELNTETPNGVPVRLTTTGRGTTRNEAETAARRAICRNEALGLSSTEQSNCISSFMAQPGFLMWDAETSCVNS